MRPTSMSGGSVPVCGYVDLQGVEVVPPQYSGCGPLSDGMALVGVGKHAGDDRSGYIDAKGKFALNPTYTEATDFGDGVAAVTSGEGGVLIDKTGRELCKIAASDKLPGVFHDGLAQIELSDGKYGYIDKTCKLVLSGLESASDFTNGLASVTRDGRGSYVDAAGKSVWTASAQ